MPTYTTQTERAYALLPEHHRRLDDAAGHPLTQPLKRYLALIGDRLNELVVLIDRIARRETVVGTAIPKALSDLADATLADAAWLPWLAQTVGIETKGRTTEELRALIAQGARSTGSAGALIAAAKAALTGTKTANLFRHANGPWVAAVATRHDETADPAAVLDAVIPQTPAGMQIEHRFGVQSWSQFETEYPTWAELEAEAPTWQQMEDGS